MIKKQSNWLKRGLPVYLALALLIAFGGIFLYEILSLDEGSVVTPSATLSAETYMDKVNALLQDAQPERGAALIEQYQCASCHVAGVANNVAPSYEGLSEHAAYRRPPLTAAAYIYESIVNPSAYVVEGYNNVMRQDYAVVIPDHDLGDIIAYLLTR